MTELIAAVERVVRTKQYSCECAARKDLGLKPEECRWCELRRALKKAKEEVTHV